MGSIISFANQKGGVGKTTSAVNIAASLGLLGSRVLLIDLDPQGNATSGVGIIKKDLRGTTREFLSGDADASNVIFETEFTNLWAIPSNTSLAGAEFDLFDFEDSEYRLKNLLEPLKKDYDYIIIDCPPSLGMLTVNALSASDGIVVPMQCEFYSLEGVQQLMMTIRAVHDKLNPNLSVLGFLLTMYDRRYGVTRAVDDDVRKAFGDQVFKTVVPRNVRMSEAPSFGKPALFYDFNCSGAQAYLRVATEIIQKLEGDKNGN